MDRFDPNTVSNQPPPGFQARDLIRAMRPSQWTKNAVVLAAFFFAYWDRQIVPRPGAADLVRAVIAAALFCVASGGVYVLNDIIDAEADRAHPTKRHRPVASGRLPVGAGWCESFILLFLALAGSWLLSPGFAGVVCGYVGLQLVYTLALKRVALVDIVVIALGFVIRAVSGAVVAGVRISPWLLLCTFLLALFLALCKRRHEKVNLDDAAAEHRPSLMSYDAKLLDQLIAVCASTTVASYSIYTLWPDTVEKFGTSCLGLTIPFVVFGIFRYMHLVYCHHEGDRPEKVLLTDLPLIADLVLYVLAVAAVFSFCGKA